MKRRRAIHLIGLASLSPLFANALLSLLPTENNSEIENSNKANDAMSALSIGVGIAKWFYGFFQSNTENNGPTIADFAKGIAEQITITNKKLDIIIEQSNELKNLIRELPLDIISKMNQIQLKARLDDYKAIMTTISLPRTYNGSIRQFMRVERNRQEVLKLVSQIKEVKSNLRQFNDPFLVPFVAAGVHIEYYLRSNFLQDSWKDFVGDVANDKNWLHYNVFDENVGLEKRLKSAKADYSDLKIKNHQFISIARITVTYGGNGPYVNQWGTKPLLVYKSKLDVITDESIKEDDDVEILRNNLLLTESERPFKFVQNEGEKILSDGRGTDYTDFPVEFTPPIESLEQQKERFKVYRQQKFNNLNEELKLKYYSILANASSYFAGLKALEFCNIYLRLANLEK